MIPLVVASERGRAQTHGVAMHHGGSRTTLWHADGEENCLESQSIEGERPVSEARCSLVVS